MAALDIGEGFPDIIASFPDVAEAFRDIPEPFPDFSMLFPKPMKSFPKIGKPLRDMWKPIPISRNHFPNLEKRILKSRNPFPMSPRHFLKSLNHQPISGGRRIISVIVRASESFWTRCIDFGRRRESRHGLIPVSVSTCTVAALCERRSVGPSAVTDRRYNCQRMVWFQTRSSVNQ